MPHRLFLVEDHLVVRDGLRALLSSQPDLEVVGEAASAREALAALDADPVDLVVVDVRIADGDGIELTKNLRAVQPGVAVVVLSAHAEATHADRAFRAGALSYVTKTEPAEVLLLAVREALAGRMYLSPALRGHAAGPAPAGPGLASASALSTLTDRELEVFGHFGRGLSTAQVADAMVVSPKTVETHRVHIKRKLGLSTANEFVQRAALWVDSTGT